MISNSLIAYFGAGACLLSAATACRSPARQTHSPLATPQKTPALNRATSPTDQPPPSTAVAFVPAPETNPTEIYPVHTQSQQTVPQADSRTVPQLGVQPTVFDASSAASNTLAEPSPLNSAPLASNLTERAAVTSIERKSIGPVRLVISGVRPRLGAVKVAIFNNAASFPQPTGASQTMVLDAASETLEAFPNKCEKQFAVAVYQDINSDGELNRNRLGVPLEPFAFSNNAMGKRGPPTFVEATISIDKAGSSSVDVPIKLP